MLYSREVATAAFTRSQLRGLLYQIRQMYSCTSHVDVATAMWTDYRTWLLTCVQRGGDSVVALLEYFDQLVRQAHSRHCSPDAAMDKAVSVCAAACTNDYGAVSIEQLSRTMDVRIGKELCCVINSLRYTSSPSDHREDVISESPLTSHNLAS